MTKLPQVTGGEGELLLLLEHCQPSEMSQRPKSHQVWFSKKSKVRVTSNALQAQKVRGGAEKGGRQVLTEQLLIVRPHCLESLVGLIGRVLKNTGLFPNFG